MTSDRTPDDIDALNAAVPLFTAGPASLAAANVAALRPCFGRGDAAYAATHAHVLQMIGALAEQDQVVALQGSGTSALEVMIANFLFGRVLVVDSGYYAQRLQAIAVQRMRDGFITSVGTVAWDAMAQASGAYDWVLGVYTETSEALLVPLAELAALAQRVGARLALDATASIGLETDHGAADVCAFSSCKGLFGLTGAGFVAHSVAPDHDAPDMLGALSTYAGKKTTGPYHAMQSLEPILAQHAAYAEAVRVNKRVFAARFADHLMHPPAQQPQLCTALDVALRARDPRAVLCAPRQTRAASITCHLGEVHLGRAAAGRIVDLLELA
jgi:2-aminoethylphosphonate-pyruvate transaminase